MEKNPDFQGKKLGIRRPGVASERPAHKNRRPCEGDHRHGGGRRRPNSQRVREKVRDRFPTPEVLESLEKKARAFLSAARLDAMIAKCHEAEYDGDDNLALERYRATWEFLQKNPVPHPNRAKISVSVRERIRRLERKVSL